MKNPLAFVIVAGLLFAFTGCTARLVDYTIISTKNVDLARAGSFQKGKSRVQGEDKMSIIIFIPTGVPNVKEAIDRAIESVPGAVALVDGVVDYRYFWIPYIYGEETYIVEGTPLIDPNLASASELKSQFMIAKVNKDGDLKELKYVTPEEYQKAKARVFKK